jgi:CBS domain-containing protein
MAVRLVSDLVHDQDILTVPESLPVRDATRQMDARNVGAVLVTDSAQRLIGIFTERDLLRRVVAQGRDPTATTVAEVMTRDPETVGPRQFAVDALRLMREGSYRHLPVVDGDRIVGVLSQRDFYGDEVACVDDQYELWQRL